MTTTTSTSTSTPDTLAATSLLNALTAPEPASLPVDPRVVTLRSDTWELGVLPGTGGSLAFGRVLVDGRWLDLLRPARPTVYGAPEKCASFPLVPWSNRIRDGVLRFRGRTWTLAHNAADGTAMHGAVASYTWRVVDRTAARVELELDTRDLVGVNFPWRFRSRLVYELDGTDLRVTTTVENVDAEPFPAGFGHHPYFQRRLTPAAFTTPSSVAADGSDEGDAPTPTPSTSAGASSGTLPGSDAVLHVPADRGYALESAMAVTSAGVVRARADYREPRPLGTAFVDDVLTGLRPGEPVRWTYPDHGVEVRLGMDDVYSHLVVYLPRRRTHFAVEPVTNVNDGFALHDAGVEGTGVFVLEPGESRSGTFTLSVGRV
ncbi:aldose epimerase [Cellulomonas sp. NS3]|uniref:aldose epimerase family protein n=1 Tax=Cellulomonas sp. NS3 TaxID=2973977 RepID=UPI0021615D62|nr:aldose epimerase [Cellulomonas sp. NS3]